MNDPPTCSINPASASATGWGAASPSAFWLDGAGEMVYYNLAECNSLPYHPPPPPFPRTPMFTKWVVAAAGSDVALTNARLVFP